MYRYDILLCVADAGSGVAIRFGLRVVAILRKTDRLVEFSRFSSANKPVLQNSHFASWLLIQFCQCGMGYLLDELQDF